MSVLAAQAVDPELARLRDSIDNFDAALIHLLAERFRCTQRVGELKARLDELRTQSDRLQREGDYAAASRLLYGDIPAAEAELVTAQEEEARGSAPTEPAMVKD